MNTASNGSYDQLSEADVIQTDGNMRLASQFIREYLDASDDYGPIPLGAAVILLPPADSDEHQLRSRNLDMARRLTEQGREVVLWTVGSESSSPYMSRLGSLKREPA